MKAVVAGGTGLVGSSLLSELLKNPRVDEVTLVVRRKISLIHPKIKLILLEDFSELETQPKPGLSTLGFCALGTTIKKAGSQEAFRRIDYEAILHFANWCRSVDRFSLVSSMGADPKSPFFYNRVKGQTEQSVQSVGIKSIDIFRPGLLLGERAETRPVELAFTKVFNGLKVVLPRVFAARMATEVTRLAEIMVEKSFETHGEVKFFEPKDLA